MSAEHGLLLLCVDAARAVEHHTGEHPLREDNDLLAASASSHIAKSQKVEGIADFRHDREARYEHHVSQDPLCLRLHCDWAVR